MPHNVTDPFTYPLDPKLLVSEDPLRKSAEAHTEGPDEGEQLLPAGPKGSSPAKPKGGV